LTGGWLFSAGWLYEAAIPASSSRPAEAGGDDGLMRRCLLPSGRLRVERSQSVLAPADWVIRWQVGADLPIRMAGPGPGEGGARRWAPAAWRFMAPGGWATSKMLANAAKAELPGFLDGSITACMPKFSSIA